MIGALAPWDLQVFVGEPAIAPEIAYGIERMRTELLRKGVAHPVGSVALTGESYTLSAIFAEPFWIGDASHTGWLQLPQVPLMDLELGDALEYERRIHLGARADVSSVTDGLLPEAPRVSGAVLGGDAHLHVHGEDGAPLTSVRPRADGSFSFRAPARKLRLRLVSPSGETLERELTVDEDLVLEPFALTTPARLVIPAGLRGRFVILDAGGGTAPELRPDLLGFRVGGAPARHALASNDVSRSGVEHVAAEIPLPPGAYRVIVTRGLEYELSEHAVTLSAGERHVLGADLPERVLDTSGWIAADLHVHSGESWDSSLPLAMQVAAFVAQGAEVLVSTEHDRVIDPRPAIEGLGLSQVIAAFRASRSRAACRPGRARSRSGTRTRSRSPGSPRATAAVRRMRRGSACATSWRTCARSRARRCFS